MKYFYLLLLPTCLFGQTIDVDSLERKGYHVYVHKKHAQPRVIVKEKIVRDTVWLERTIVKRDTVHIYTYHEQTVTPQYVLLNAGAPDREAFEEAFTLALVGTANTNGYEMHGGATLSLGERIKFFIGAGCAYNSVLKVTRLDLGGHLIIRLY